MTSKPSDARDKPEKPVRPMEWLSLGLEFGAVLALFTYGGYGLDRALRTDPWCLLGGFFLALIGMLYLTIRRALNDEKNRRP